MIVCGYSLNPSQKQEIKPYLANFQLETFTFPGILGSGLHAANQYFPDLSFQSIDDLLAYGLPLQVYCGKSDSSLLSKFYHHGIAAVVFVENGFSKPIDVKVISHHYGIIITKASNLTHLFRQIFLFAGIKVRTDLQTVNELELVLPTMLSNNDSQLHVMIDLDNEIDYLPILHLLAEYNNNSKIFVWSIKDFAQPGPNPLILQQALLPFTSRIFTPLEAMISMVEAFFLYDESLVRFSATAGSIQKFDGFHDIERILKGKSIDLLDRNPATLWQTLKQLTNHLQDSLPFHWLYSLFQQNQESSGAVLVNPKFL